MHVARPHRYGTTLALLGLLIAASQASPSAAMADTPWRLSDIGVVPGAISSGAAVISNNGQVVAGYCNFPDGQRAMRWTPAHGMEIIDPNPPAGASVGSFITDNGETIVISRGGTGPSSGQSLVWTSGVGAVPMSPPAGWASSGVSGMTGDGVTMSGTCVRSAQDPCDPDAVEIAAWLSAGGAFQFLPNPFAADPLCRGCDAGGGLSDDGTTVWGAIHFKTTLCDSVVIGITWQSGVPFVHSDIVGRPSDRSANGRIVVASDSVFVSGVNMPTFDYLHSLGCDMTGWSGMRATSISDSGNEIVGIGTHNGQTRAWILDLQKDSDGDGLYDDWETDGIPYLSNEGVYKRYLLPEADPYHKDVYVEVDAMGSSFGHAPVQAGLDRVVEAFAQAPIPAPDPLLGRPGIALHILVDELYVPARDYVDASTDSWSEFRADKATFFGTFDERQDPSWPSMRKAKANAYRYCLFVKKIASDIGDGVEGIAELYPDEPTPNDPPRGTANFMVATFGISGLGNNGIYSFEDDQAITFMHELGHTLGLHHGGGDNHNYKPNYLSVMNYLWSSAFNFASSQFQGRMPLRYSDRELGTLVESALYEHRGIGGNVPGLRIPIVVRAPGTVYDACFHLIPPLDGICADNLNGATFADEFCARWVPFSGRVDWDNNLVLSPWGVPVCGNPNYMDPFEYPQDTLKGFDDWANLAYGIVDSPYHDDLAYPPHMQPCIPKPVRDMLNALPPPPTPCPAPPPVVGTPVVSTAAGLTRFTVRPVGEPPFMVQWRRYDATQTPPWVPLVSGTMPGGTVVSGTEDFTLAFRAVNPSDFTGADLAFGERLSCLVMDACDQTSTSSEAVFSFAGPVLTQVSPTTVVLCPGENASFSISAAGCGPFVYQWAVGVYPNDSNLFDLTFSNGTSVQGSGTPTLTLTNLQADGFGYGSDFVVFCWGFDACGHFARSEPFRVHIGGPLITADPETVGRPCTGGADVVFSVQAIGVEPLTYRWSRDGSPLTDDAGGHIAGSETATLTIVAPTEADRGTYTCVATCPCGSTESGQGDLYIGPPRLLSDPPAPFQVCPGGQGIIHVQATGSPSLSYQWMRNGVDLADGNLPSGTQVFGSQTEYLFINGVTPADTGTYTVRVQNACGTIVSQPAASVVLESPAIAAQPANKLTCPTGSVTLSIQPAGDATNLAFLWQVEDPSDPNGWVFIGDASLVIGGTQCATVVGDFFSSSLTVSWAGLPECGPSHRFRCYEVSPCGYIISDPATVRICKADFNCSGALAVSDIFAFLDAWFAGSPTADFNGNGLAVSDIFGFLDAWFSGC